MSKVGAIVEMIQCAWGYIVWDNNLFFGFSWDEDTGVTSSYEESVRSHLGSSDQESDFVIEVSRLGGRCLPRHQVIFRSFTGVVILLSLDPSSSVKECAVYLVSTEEEVRFRLDDRFDRCTLGRRI